jgi:hypothetical protein
VCSLRVHWVVTAYSLNRTVETVSRAVSRVSGGAALYALTRYTYLFALPLFTTLFSLANSLFTLHRPFTARIH